MGKLKRKKEKLLKDKKGSMAIEIVIGMFMFLIVLCFLLDLTVLGWKFSVVSQVNSKVARVSGIQGGVLTTAPNGFPGGNSAYTDINELNAMLVEHFKQAGIAENEWKLYIDGRHVLGSGARSATRQIEYRESFATRVEITYKWDMISNFIPGTLKNTLKSSRPTMSEWKYNYDSWVGE